MLFWLARTCQKCCHSNLQWNGMPLVLLFLVRMTLVLWALFWFHMSFMIFQFCEWWCWYFGRGCIGSLDRFGQCGHFNAMNSFCGHEMIVHFSPLKHFHQCFLVFLVEIFHLLGKIFSAAYHFHFVAVVHGIAFLISFPTGPLLVYKMLLMFVCWFCILQMSVLIYLSSLEFSGGAFTYFWIQDHIFIRQG